MLPINCPIKRVLTRRALARSVVFVLQGSLFCHPHTRSSFPPKHFCITHPELELLPAPSLANARSYGLACSPYGHVPSPLLDGLLVHMVVVASRHQGTNRATRLQMTKEARGGSRVIHGQNCPISAEISQKLDLYPDRPKSGRLCREASQSPTHGARPRSFLPQILLVGSVPGFARAVIHTHSRADTPS